MVNRLNPLANNMSLEPVLLGRLLNANVGLVTTAKNRSQEIQAKLQTINSFLIWYFPAREEIKTDEVTTNLVRRIYDVVEQTFNGYMEFHNSYQYMNPKNDPLTVAYSLTSRFRDNEMPPSTEVESIIQSRMTRIIAMNRKRKQS